MRLLSKKIERKLKNFMMSYSIERQETPLKRLKEDVSPEEKEIVHVIVMKVNKKGMDLHIR
jgi:hypothetical protein